MKIKLSFFALTILMSMVALSSCRQKGCTSTISCNYDEDAKEDDGTCINKGQVTFWQDSTSGAYDVVVTINATDATITSRIGTTPLCDASGMATFSLCPGSHNYTARQAFPGVQTWTGNVTSLEDDCVTVLLQ